MRLFLLVPLCLAVCPRFACHSASEPLPAADVCMYTRNDTKVVAACSDGFYCPSRYESEEVRCEKVEQPVQKVLPGERCDSNDTCVTGNCESGTCMGLRYFDYCRSHADCHVGLFCGFFSYCMPQMAERMLVPCRNEYDCRNDFTCHGGRCMRYFSLSERDTVHDCVGNQSVACSSGMCFNGYCLRAIENDAPLPKRCDSRADCTASWYSSEHHSFPFFTECECAWDKSGSSVCSLFPGDPPYQSYLRKLTYYLGRSTRCHTLNRMSPACMRRSLTRERFHDLALAYFEFVHFPRLQLSEGCVQTTFLNDYWGEWSTARFLMPALLLQLF